LFCVGCPIFGTISERLWGKFSCCELTSQRFAIASACSTKILYNPANYSTAENFSQSYGNKEFIVKNKSISNSKEGQTVTWTDNLQTMPILTADEIMRFPQGKCVITNPGYTSNNEGSIPYPLTIPIPKLDIRRILRSEQLWEQQVCPRLIMRSTSVDVSQLEEAIDLRKQIAEQLLKTGDIELPVEKRVETEQIELVSPTSESAW
jgi:type IV secretion system protein VirD4